MSSLHVEELKRNRDEILKAEIGTLLFNLGKTHIGFWQKRGAEDYWKSHFGLNDIDNFKNDFKNRFRYKTFTSYRNYYNRIMAGELKRINPDLHDFILAKHKVKIPGKDSGQEEGIDFFEFIKGSSSSEQFVKSVFFRGCENINSGIDKGAPSSGEQQLKGVLWLANAFGSFRNRVDIKDLDEARISFYRDLDAFLASRGYYENPAWDNIRNFVVHKIKAWYSLLLSDSRFPINDVTLWDQAFMSASMFKAVLAELYLNPDLKESYVQKPIRIRWRILGIQYDKLGLAEKGHKISHIKWYRDKSRFIDDQIKELLECTYPIGNEIYRDETGIYFLVGESLGEDREDSQLAVLHNGLEEIKREILAVFKEHAGDEFYPAIFLTRPSRGLMNLTYIWKMAKENFLQADWSSKEINRWLEGNAKGRAAGICQVCRQQLVFPAERRDEGKNICDFCFREKTQGRLQEWGKSRHGQTIWTSELRDRNGRIALVTLKFELEDWLNGDMLNSLLINRKEEYGKYVAGIKSFIILFLSSCKIEQYFDVYINAYGERVKEIEEKLKTPCVNEEFLGPQKEISKKIEEIKNMKNLVCEIRKSCWWEKPLKDDLDSKIIGSYKIEGLCEQLQKKYSEVRKSIKEELKEELKEEFYIPLLEQLMFFPAELAEDAYEGCKKNGESFEEFIEQVFFDFIVDTAWEKLIVDLLPNKINLKERKINWKSISEESDPDLDVLSELLFQFLLRKNPSPARLRRIWETTRDFLSEIENDICSYAEIPEKRRRRYYWKDVNIPEGEYYDNDVFFWSDGKNVYLISYFPDIEKHRGKFSFQLKEYAGGQKAGSPLKLENAGEYENYIPCLSVTDPTPVSWQFIIPAEHVPFLVENVLLKYDEYFRFVYGKLPLHIGVVVQDYKKPLYVGIRALRRIRRDVKEQERLYVPVQARNIKEKLKGRKCEEKINLSAEYYSLYQVKGDKGYEFFVRPDKNYKRRLASIENIEDAEQVYIIPNTFDFEIMDTNMRRNDIYYQDTGTEDNGEKRAAMKRSLFLKDCRPYDVERYWIKFKRFGSLFSSSGVSGRERRNRLQKLVSVIYEKIDCVEKMQSYLASCFINILGLHRDMELRKGLAEIFEIDCAESGFYRELQEKMTEENLRLFLDMFEFWHTGLGEV